MLAKTEVTKIYETILSMPGMSDPVKIGVSIPRKAVLLLSKVIERGLTVKGINDQDDKSASVLDMASKEELKTLADIAADILEKAGLSEMNKKLQAL